MKTLFALLVLAALPPAPGTSPGPRPLGALLQEEETERLSAWPTLEKDQKKAVDLDVQRLRKARTPEMSESAHDGLVSVGAAAAPLLLTALGKERDEDARARMTDVLETITGAAHTRLLAEHFDAKGAPLRHFALRRAARFPDAGTRAAAEAAYRKASDPKKRKKADPEDLFATALAATASGMVEPLEVLFATGVEDWGAEGEAIHLAACAVRGPEASALFVPRLGSDERDEVLGALRLLAACGTEKEAARACARHLDASDNGLRIGAINALRGILDGDPPIARLSAFDAIELAKKWKARVR